MTVDALIARLRGVQGHGPRWRAICPAHESKHETRSLAIFETDDGRVLLHCFAGCDVESIVSAVGLDLADLYPPRTDEHRAPRIRKPWATRDLIAALKAELLIAWIVLADVSAGREITDTDRKRAGVARTRIVALMDELEHAA